MAFAFTLTNKRRIDKEDPEFMKGLRWELTYSFTCLVSDTNGTKDLSGDIGGSLTITDVQVTVNDQLAFGVTTSGSSVTIAKGSTAVTGGFMKVQVVSR